MERKINNSAIFTDSLSVLSGLNNSAWSGKTHHWILKIRHSLYNCQTSNILVKLFWIPSHRGIYGNEQADLLAKESLHLPNHFLMSKCHYSNIYSKFKKLAKDKATQTLRRQSQYKGSRYFNLKLEYGDSILSTPWYKNFKGSLPRSVITLISRIRSHHTATGKHLLDKNILTSSECSCGHACQNLNHIFFQCPSLADESSALISSIKRTDPLISIDIPSIAFSNNPKLYKLLHSFVKGLNLNI
ncbi:hypothetical protein ACS0PU_006569 [Formica fusca]